jgi:hypothetical protein
MKTIQLTQNKVALIDDEDFDRISKIKWHAWYNKNGDAFYAVHSVYVKGKSPKSLKMHRHILGVTDPDLDVDHKDGDTLNNQKYNLRPCKRHQNTSHMLGLRSDNTTGYRGVSKYFYGNIKKWVARVHSKGKSISLGYFDSPEEAAKAFDKAAKELYGEFCGKLNFPEETK